jgi:predicted DCC family thiol-disulfide oxidoreductase YuxK
MPVSIAAEDRRAIVLYDGSCPLCKRSVGILKRLDWLKRLSYQDARDVEHLPEASVPLEPERLLQEMHVVTPNRRRAYAGFRAFRWMAGRLPIFWVLWPLLFIPGVPWIGQRLYRWVAKHRYHLVPCRHGACALPPPKKQIENPKPEATEPA